MKILKLVVVVPVCALIFACASTPENAGVVSDLRDRYVALANDEDVVRYAPVALENAEEALNSAEMMVKRNKKEDAIKRQAYLVERKLDIARQTTRKGKAEALISNAESMRKDIVIDARTAEARKAKMRAESLEARAESAEAQAKLMSEKAAKLQDEISEITTRKTERGLVLTLGDILFESGKSELLDGSERSLRRVSQFLADYPNRQIAVEGHTDSRGEEAFNQELSERRAASVRSALVRYNVDAGRVKTAGMGESFPIAPNDTPAGRQQNRRVDIIIEHPNT